MAITNSRTYDAQAVKASNVALGGIVRIDVAHGHENVNRQRFGGRQGNAVVHRSGKFVRGSLSCLDVTKFISVLTAAPSAGDDNIVFYVAQDGTSPTTYVKRTLLRPRYTSLSLTVPEPPGNASFDLGFECLWIKADGNAADDFHEVDTPADAQAEAGVITARTNPELLMGVTAATHGATVVQHRSRFGLRIQFEVRRNRNTDFAGPDSIIPILSAVQFDLETKDTGIVTGPPVKTAMQELLDAGADDLVLTLAKVNGASDKTLTLKNAVFIENPESHSFDNYGSFTPNGECETVDADGTTHRALGGANPIATIA